MKKIFFAFIAIFIVTNKEALAQPQQKKGTGKTVAGITINFKQRALAENKNAAQKEQLPPKENFEAENEDEEIQFQNPVTNASPFVKLQVNAPPAQAITNAAQQVDAAPCLSFQGVSLNSTAPPDPHGGVGFDMMMATTNFTIRTQSKTGGLVAEQQFSTFFNGVGGHSFIFDPKIHYDPSANRWVFICGGSGNSSNSSILMAISQTPDPSANWFIYSIDVDASNINWFDYPIVGINKNWITITGNMFTTGNSGAFFSRVWAFNKSQAYAGVGINFTFWDFSQYISISPSSNFDVNEDRMWLAANQNSNANGSGFIRLFNMTGTANAPALALGNSVNVGTAWTGGGVGGPQTGTGLTFDLGDDRIQSVIYRNGVLWTCQSFSQPATGPTYTGVQMVAFNPFTGVHIETQRIVDVNGATMCAFPSLTVNKDNDICVSYNTFYRTGYASCAVSFRRGGTSNFESYVFKGGEDWYYRDVNGSNRFGDYSSSFTDPEDDKTMWVFSEYARNNGDAVAGTDRWGTWWAKICPNFCTNSQAISGFFGSNVFRKFEVTSTITSTMQIGSGANIKLDAGSKITLSPGFRANNGSKAQIYIEGCGGVR